MRRSDWRSELHCFTGFRLDGHALRVQQPPMVATVAAAAAAARIRAKNAKKEKEKKQPKEKKKRPRAEGKPVEPETSEAMKLAQPIRSQHSRASLLFDQSDRGIGLIACRIYRQALLRGRDPSRVPVEPPLRRHARRERKAHELPIVHDAVRVGVAASEELACRTIRQAMRPKPHAI